MAHQQQQQQLFPVCNNDRGDAGSRGRLQGKKAFVTGGSSGIGAAIVELFCREGCEQVVFCDIDDNGSHTVVERCNHPTTTGTNDTATNIDVVARFVYCNVADEQQVQQVFRDVYGCAEEEVDDINHTTTTQHRSSTSRSRLDILVNNAAAFEFGRIQDVTNDSWDKVLGVNVKGYCWTVKHALPFLRNSAAPAIVNMGSISSFIAQPGFVPYNTSKGAILQLTRCLAMDLSVYGIRVNLVCPGGIDTPATARHAASQGKTVQQVSNEMAAGSCHLIPRLGRPMEVAQAVLFLASDDASFITGTHLMVDGGWSVR